MTTTNLGLSPLPYEPPGVPGLVLPVLSPPQLTSAQRYISPSLVCFLIPYLEVELLTQGQVARDDL